LPTDSSNNSGGMMMGGSVNGESILVDIINSNSSIYTGIPVNSSPPEREI